MAVLNVGRTHFMGKSYKTLQDAVNEAINGDIIQINDSKITIDKPIQNFQSGVRVQGDPKKKPVEVFVPARNIGIYLGSGQENMEFANLTFVVPEQSNAIQVSRGGDIMFTNVTMFHRGNLDERVIRPSVSFSIGDNSRGNGRITLRGSAIDIISMIGSQFTMQRSNVGNILAADRFSNHTISVITAPIVQIEGSSLQHVGFPASFNRNTKPFEQEMQITGSYLGANTIIQRKALMNQMVLTPIVAVNQERRYIQYPRERQYVPGLIVSGKNAKVSINQLAIFDHFTKEDVNKSVFAQNYAMVLSAVKNMAPFSPLGLFAGGHLQIKNSQLPLTDGTNVAESGKLILDHVVDQSMWDIQDSKQVEIVNRGSSSSLFDQSQQDVLMDGAAGKKNESAMDQLHEMIGLKPVKEFADDFVARMAMQKQRQKAGLTNGKDGIQSMHAVFSGPAGVGKAVLDRTNIPIYDKTGKVTMKRNGDLKVGDYVFNRYGKPEKVIGVYPHPQEEIYRVELVDGRYLDVSGEHLWTYKNRSGNGAKRWKTINTIDLYHKVQDSMVIRKGKKTPDVKYVIPASHGVDWPEVEHEVDSYVVGAFIGNGVLCQNQLTFSSNDVETVNKLGRLLNSGNPVKHEKNYSWVFPLKKAIQINRTEIKKYIGTKDVLPELAGHKAIDKFIPETFKYGSRDQRWALIQGLFDTDGSITNDSRRRIVYSTTSKRLVNDVQFVLYSLGIRSSIHNKGKHGAAVNDEYSLLVQCNSEDKQKFFSLTRKKAIAISAVGLDDHKRAVKRFDEVIGIRSITKLDKKEDATCIYVDDPEHLYQVGDFVVTHNTTVAELFGKALYEAHVLPTPNVKKVSAADLVSNHVGETAQNVKQVIHDAFGGILFIDEAYVLAPDKNGGGNSFKDEAVTEIVNEADEYRDKLMIIMAGYTNEMVDFFKRGNPGLRSRFANWIEFPPYSIEDLKQMMYLMLKKTNAVVADAATRKALESGIDQLVGKQGEASGQGRFVRNYIDAVCGARDVRLMKEQRDGKQISTHDLTVVTAADAMEATKKLQARMGVFR